MEENMDIRCNLFADKARTNSKWAFSIIDAIFISNFNMAIYTYNSPTIFSKGQQNYH